MRRATINLLLFLCIFTVAFATFYENPVYLLSGKNSLLLMFESYDTSNFNFSVAWQQREGELFGELGYTTNSLYTEGIVNYRIVDVSRLYALNMKLKILPLDKKVLMIDAGGLMKASDSIILSFAIHNLRLYSEESENALPVFDVDIQYLLPYSLAMNFGVLNYETKYLHFDFGISSGKILPIGELYVSYAPVYNFIEGKIYHLLSGKASFVLSNYIFVVKGFYNFSDVVPDFNELKSKYGVCLSMGLSL